MYKKFTAKDREYLETIIPRDRLLFGGEISSDYSHDELGGISAMPDALVFVLSTEEVSAVMKYAYRENLPVVVRGSGTVTCGGGSCAARRNNALHEPYG